TRFDSAMPTLKNRSGNFLAKKSVRVELCTSPSTTTTSLWAAPNSASARPNASRVDLPCFRFIGDPQEEFTTKDTKFAQRRHKEMQPIVLPFVSSLCELRVLRGECL